MQVHFISTEDLPAYEPAPRVSRVSLIACLYLYLCSCLSPSACISCCTVDTEAWSLPSLLLSHSANCIVPHAQVSITRVSVSVLKTVHESVQATSAPLPAKATKVSGAELFKTFRQYYEQPYTGMVEYQYRLILKQCGWK